MASKSSTTLFSTYKASSKINRNYSRNGANSSRYVVGSVGKAFGKHIRFGGSSSGTSCSGNHSHANVAIATQVLNPSAIGGSLKNQRLVEHFGSKEDDEISFLSGKSRAVCSKVCFYGISIGVTMIMITGLVIAVGYMQSEKDRIATRPVKLAQGQDFQSSTTHQPPAILYGTTTTTVKSTLTSSEDSDNEIDNNGDEDEGDDDMDEIGVDPPNHGPNGNRGIFNFKLSTNPDSSFSTFQHHQKHPHHHDEDIHSANDDENSISDEYAKPQGNYRYGHHPSDGEDEINTSPEEDLHHEVPEDDTHPPSEAERPFSEVRVKPPSNFFAGISFEVPIYRVNSTTVSTTEKVTSATPTPSTSSTTDLDIIDYVGELHPNNRNDLSETETESRSSSASMTTPTTVSNATELEETKELETSINHSNSNSGPNFTSLVDSSEKTNNESDSERGEALFSDLNNRNYANAKNYNQNPSHSQDEESLDSQDFTQTKHFKPISSENGIKTLSQPNLNSDRYNSNRDDGIIGKTSSRFSNTKNQHDKTTIADVDNDEDFAIGESTTSTVATLQTDIFDADEFQTSASEESEIDADVDTESDDKPIASPTTRPQKPKNKNRNNHHEGNNNSKELTRSRPNNKGPRKGKILRPMKTSTYPPPSSYLDDYETETTSIKTNGRIKDGKKLSLRPHKKIHVKLNGFGHGDHNLKQDQDLDPTAAGGPITIGSEEIPNLNYKVDFSRYIPKTTPATPSSPENNHNIEYQPPHNGPYPNFNFSPSPPEHHKPFDLEEYLNKHAKKTGSSGNSDTSSLGSSSLSPQPSSNLDLSALAQYQSYKVDTSTSPLLYTASSGNTNGGGGAGGSSGDSLGGSSLFPQQDNQFSKRTFYNSESYSNTNDNSFAHLLGPQTPSNNFGAVTATGATLNLFQPQPSYNFNGGLGNFQNNYQNNNGGAGSTNNYNIPSFNALSASAQSNAQHGFSVDANGAFSLITPSNLPYPNIPTGGGGGNAYGGTNLGGNNYQNTFSFNNEPISSSKNLVLTTGAGQVPTYNTITQGIHLLSLLSGRGGNSENENGNGYDQLSSGSSIYQNIAQPEGQIPSLTGYSNNYNDGGSGPGFGSQLNFGNWKNSGFPSQNFQKYEQDLFPNKNLKNFGNSENDQDSSASGTSFSRSIVLKAPELGRKVKAIQSQNLDWGSTGVLSPFQRISSKINTLGSTPSPISTQPKSLSIKILPKPNKQRLTLAMTPAPPTPKAPPSHSSELESLAPKSRKRLMDPEPDVMEVGESRLQLFANNEGKNSKSDPSRSLTGSTLAGGGNVKGLKSGFFN